MAKFGIIILLLIVVLITEIKAMCATKEDCYEGRFCCFGVCAKTCNVKKRPTAKCRKFQHCARNEYCKRGFCALLPGEDQIPTRSPDDGGQHPVYPVFPTYP